MPKVRGKARVSTGAITTATAHKVAIHVITIEQYFCDWLRSDEFRIAGVSTGNVVAIVVSPKADPKAILPTIAKTL